MNIDVNDPKQLLSHVILQDGIAASAIRETIKDTKKDEPIALTATVFVNGVEISAKSFEETLHHFVEQLRNHYKEKYDATKFDERVKKEAKKIVRNYNDKMWDEFELWNDE